VKLVRKNFALSSSDLDRLEQCPAAGAYRLQPKPELTFPQWYGIFVHRFLQYAVEQGRDYALAYIRSKRMKGVVSTCEKIDVDAIPAGAVEVGFSHDVLRNEAVVLPPNERTENLNPASEQYCRADLISEHQKLPLVVDYKCGSVDSRHPAREVQLLGIAAALRASWTDPWELSAVRPSGYYVALVGVRSTGALDWSMVKVDDADINEHLARAKRVQLRVMDVRASATNDARDVIDAFVKGPACELCELKPACPAHDPR
jgi:hypothetical protein